MEENSVKEKEKNDEFISELKNSLEGIENSLAQKLRENEDFC